MRLVIREVPYDLYAVVLLSTLLVISIVVAPDFTAARIVLGLPFILLFPGYVLISALYPERKSYFDSEGWKVPDRQASEGLDEDVDAEDEDGQLGKEGKAVGKGLDGLERLALSLGLSIAITPLIGLVLNWTYDWDPERLGIRLWLVLASIYIFNIIGAGAAIYRRSRVPLEDRFGIEVRISLPKDGTPVDRSLTIGIVVMMVLSVSLLIYIIVVPREGESFTEFYVLGPSGKAEGYPSDFIRGEVQSIFIGIGNHEHGDRNYTILLSIDPLASNRSVPSLDDIKVSRKYRPGIEVSVPKGDNLRIPCNFSIEDIGHHKLRLLLFMGGKEHRDLHLWVRVFAPGYLASMPGAGSKAFLAGAGGDPGALPRELPEGAPITVSIGLANRLEGERDVNISIHLDSPYSPTVVPPSGQVSLAPGKGAFMVIKVQGGTSTITEDMDITLPKGNWTLKVEVSSGEGSAHFDHPLVVGDPG